MSEKKLRLSVILEAIDRLSGPMRGATSQADRAGKAFRATRDRVRALNAAQRDMAAHSGLRERLVADTLALRQARVRADELKTAFSQTEQPTAKLTRAFTRARDEVQRLEQAQGAHRTGLRELETRLEAAGVDTRRLSDEEARLRRETDGATAELNQQRDALAQLGREQRRVAEARATYERTRQTAAGIQSTGQSSVAAGVAAAAPALWSGREAVGLEAAMADIRKVVDFETPQQFDQMRRDILDLTTVLPMTGAEIAAIVAEAGQANIPRGELMGFARDAGMMGVAFDTTADQAGDMMATWRTAFRMGADEVRTLADQINYLGNNSAAGVQAVSNIVTRVGPLGEIGGLAAHAIAALGATMAAVGVDDAQAATGIQRLIVRMTAGTAATRQQQEAFRRLGLDAGQVARDMQRDAAVAITDVMQRISQVPDAERGAMLKMLFGEQTIAAIAPILNNLDLLQSHLDMVGDESRYAGSMLLEFEAVNDTASSALARARGGVAGLANQLGQDLLPLIKTGSAWVIEKTSALRAFAQAHPGVIRVVGGLMLGLSAVLIVFGGLAMAVAAVLGPFALMRFAFIQALPVLSRAGLAVRALGTAFSWLGRAMLMNPVGLAVAGVGLAIAGLFLVVRKYWTPISAFARGMGQVFSEALAPLRGLLQPLAPIWNAVSRAVGGFFGWIGRLLTPVEMTGDQIEGATEAGRQFARMIVTAFNWTPIGLFLRAIRALHSGFQTLRDAFPAIKASFAAFGRDLVLGMINGIFGGLPGLLGAIRNIGGQIINRFKERLGIRSPSRVFAALGVDTVQGLVRGVDRSLPDAQGAMARLGAGMAGALALASPAGMATAAPGAGAAPTGQIIVNVYPSPGQDPAAIADEVLRRLNDRAGRAALSAYRDDHYGE